ncbi:cobalamin biosynthesis protein CbiG [Hyphococcus sp.]|uniref:cobalamin biosynthesis protein CbiG n=1 Tax=Hyphococcus sp. TaxID=2038636 RepID=UPI003CCBAE5F
MTMAPSENPLFDVYIIVDWSAANSPKRGKDSIWIASAERRGEDVNMLGLENPATRHEAITFLENIIRTRIALGERVFAGFDFPFGYPKGAAKKITGAASWRAIWRRFHIEIEDSQNNRSNRFHVANMLNAEVFRSPVYWGRPHQHRYSHLPSKKDPSTAREAMEFRLTERAQPPSKSVWQLAYNGAVGSQAMLGMAWMEEMRRRFGEAALVWPFETNFSQGLIAPLILAEIYPTMFPATLKPYEVKDRAQVRICAKTFAETDARGDFRRWLSAPPILDEAARCAVLEEEGWIVGAGWATT